MTNRSQLGTRDGMAVAVFLGWALTLGSTPVLAAEEGSGNGAATSQPIESTDPEDIEVVDDATLDALKKKARMAAEKANKERQVAEKAEKESAAPAMPGEDKKPDAEGSSDEIQKQIEDMRKQLNLEETKEKLPKLVPPKAPGDKKTTPPAPSPTKPEMNTPEAPKPTAEKSADAKPASPESAAATSKPSPAEEKKAEPPSRVTRMPAEEDAPFAVISPDKEKDFWDIPPEDRLFSVNYRKATIQGVLEDFSRYTGLPVLNMEKVEKATGVQISYRTREDITFDEYRQLVNQWLSQLAATRMVLLARETYLDLRPLNEIQWIVQRGHRFESEEAFHKADLPDDVPALLWHVPKAVSAAKLVATYRTKVPDYAMIRQVGDRNEIEIIAKSEDVRRFLEYCNREEVNLETPALRTIKIIKIEKSQVDEIADLVRELTGGGRTVGVPTPPRRGAPPVPATNGDPSADDVDIHTDPINNVLIVRANAENIRLVEEIVAQLDPLALGTTSDAAPIVVKLQHADATALSVTLSRIAAGGGPAMRPGKPLRPGRAPTAANLPGGGGGGDGEMTIIPETGTNSLVFLGDPEEVEKLMPLVKLFDVEDETETQIEYLKLKHADAKQIQTALAPLIQRRPKTPTDVLATLTADPGGNGVFIRGSTKDIEKITGLVEMLDQHDPEGDQIHRYFLMKHIPVQEAVQIVNALRLPTKAGVPPTQMTGVAVGTGVFVFGAQSDVDRVAEVLLQADVETGGVMIERFALKHADALTIQPMLNQMINRPPLNQKQGPPVVTADQAGNAILVRGVESDIEKARELILLIDVEAGEDAPKTFVLSPKNAQPSLLANVINGLAAANQPTTKGKGATVIRAVPDDASRKLVVISPETFYNERILPVVEEWDLPVADDQLVQKTFVMKYASPAEVATVLMTMTTPAGKEPSKVKIAPTQTSVVVQAPPDRMERIVALISEIDVGSGEDAPKTFVLSPKNALPSLLANVINGMAAATQPTKGKSAAVVRAVPDDASRKLVVIAPETFYNDRIMPVVAEWDLPVDEDQLVQKTFVMEYANPAEVATVLMAMTKPTGKEPPNVQIAPTRTSVVVQAPPDRMERITDLVAEIDTDKSSPAIRKTYPLKGLDVNIVAKTLTGLFANKKDAKTTVEPAFIPDPYTSMLFVSAPQSAYEQIEAVLDEMKHAVEASPPMAIEHIPLDHAAAEVVKVILEPLLQAKMGELSGDDPKGKKAGAGFTVTVDERTNNLIVAGPGPILELANVLVTQLDIETGERQKVLRQVQLQKTRAEEMVKTIMGLMQGQVQEGAKEVKGAPKFDQGGSVFVVAAPGSNVLVLRGLAKDVEELEKWILEIDDSAYGYEPVFKPFVVTWMDVDELADQIMALLDSGRSGGGGGGKGKKAKAGDEGDEGGDLELVEGDDFGFDDFGDTSTSSGPRIGKEIRILTDYFANEMTVLTTPQKMAQVESYIEMTKPAPGEEGKPIITSERDYHLVNLEEADAFYVSMDLQDAIDVLYPSPRNRPKVESVSFLNMIKITGTNEQAETVKGWIRDYFDRPKISSETKVVLREVPLGAKAESVALMLAAQGNMNIDIQALRPATGTEPDAAELINEIPIRPLSNDPAPNKIVLPSMMNRLQQGVSALIQAQQAEGESKTPQAAASEAATSKTAEAEAEPKAPAEKPAEKPVKEVEEPAQAATDSPKPEPAAKKPEIDPKMAEDILTKIAGPKLDRSKPLPKPKVTIRWDNKTGRILIEGPTDLVYDIEDMYDELVDALEETPEIDIRVFELQHVDVSLAASIVDQMFNTRIAAPTAAQQQQQAQQQMQAQQQQQQIDKKIQNALKQAQAGDEDDSEDEDDSRSRSRRSRSRDDGDDEEGDDKPTAPRRPTRPSAQPKGDRVRIIPDPRMQTVIVRAPTGDFPLIAELLNKIDRPMTRPVDYRIFRLKNLNAADVEKEIKTILGIGQSGRAGGGGRPQPGQPARPGQPQQQANVPQPPVAMEGPTLEGDDQVNPAAFTTITSDPTTNSVIVMAPAASMEIIDKLIEDLDGTEPNRTVLKTIELKFANVSDLVPSLQDIFRAQRGGGRAATGSDPTEIGGIQFASEPRTNTLVIRSSTTDLEKVIGLVEQLDVPTGEAKKVDIYTVEAADVGQIATTLQQIYGGRSKRGGEDGALDVKIVGDTATNSLLVWAPPAIREEIKVTIDELSQQAGDLWKPREIQLKLGNAESIAGTLTKGFGRSSGGSGRNIRVIGDNASRTLLVIAPNDIFEEIQRFAKLLDEREEDIQLKVFPLKNAKSEELLAKFTQMTSQLMTSANRSDDSFQMDLFAASADPRTNSLVVMGKPATFVLVDTVIQQLDIPPLEDPNQIIKHFHLEKTQAAEIATAINNLFAGKDTGGVDPPKAEPNTNTNSVVVRGTLHQLEEIEKEIIKKLEAYVSPIQDKFKMHRFAVNHANVVELAEILTNHFTQKFNNLSTAGIAGLQPVDRTIGIMPDKTTSTLVVQASEANLKELEELLKMYDTAELFGDDVRSVKLFTLEYASPSYVVTAITQTYPTTPSMIEKDMIGAILEPGTEAIIVTANEKNMVKVEELITKIDIDRGTTRQTFFHDVKNVRPSDIVTILSSTVASQRRKRNEAAPVIQASDITNKLMITATPREYEEMRGLIEQLDVEGAFAAGRVTKFYRPEFIAPSSLSTVIGTNLAGSGGQRLEDAIQVTVEPTTQVLLVTASEENHNKVQALIDELDLEEAQGRVTEIIKLEHALPSEMVQLLNGTGVANQRRGVRDTIPLTFTPDAQRNTLVVNGTKRDVESVRGMIAKLDTPIDIQGGRRIEVYPIQFTDPQYVLNAINALVNPTGRSKTPDEVIDASIDDSSYSLIVSATPKNHERVAEIILKMDQEEGGKEIQTVELEHATPSAVIEMLTSVYSATRKTRRSGPPVTFIPDAAHNSIILTGARREIGDALVLIAEFDKAPNEGTGRTVEIYPVNYTSPSYVAGAISTLYPETRDTKPEDRVAVTIDSTTSTLIVSAIPKNHQKVADLLAKMDKEGEGKLTEIVPLQHATPTEVIRLMTQVYSTTRKQKQNGEQVVNFIDDPAHNAIVLTGSQREIGKAKDLIAQFDIEPIAGAGRTIEVYPIKYTTPSYVQDAITALMNPTGRTKTPEDMVSVSLDHTSYSLIVSATAPNHAKIKEIVAKMDIESDVAKKTEIVKLKHATPTDVIQILTSIYSTTRKRTQIGEQPVNFIPDAAQNAIVMTGPSKEIEDAIKLVERFDIPPDEGAGRAIKIYPVRYTSPSYAEQAINSLSAPVSGRQKKPEDLIQITVDHSNYALIISATPKMHEKIADLLSKMDVESERTDDIELVRLEYATPDDVISMLQNVYGATRRTTQRGEKPVTFLPDPMHNGVVLTGPPHEIEDAKVLIAKFDTPPEEGTDRRIEVYPIQFTSPNYVQAAVESLLNPTGRNIKAEDRVTASIDSVTNSLIVSATAKNHEKVAEVILKMDHEGEMVKDTEIVPLENASPQDVINLLSSVYETTRRRSQRGEQPVNFVADVAHNAIVVTGARKEIASAKDLIQKFDTPADADAGITVEVYPVKYASPVYVQQAISNLFASSSRSRTPEEVVNVTVEHSTYSLIVSASAGNHERIVELLAKVDKEGEGKVTEFVELKEAVPADVIAVLSTVYQTTRKRTQDGDQPVNFIEDAAHNAIVLTGAQVEVDKAKVLIAKLDLPPLDDLGRTIKVHRVEFIPPSTIQSLVQNTMAAKGRVAPEERVDVTSDPTTGTVIVYANTQNHEKIDELISELDKEGESKDVVEIIELVNARASDIATTLTQMLSSTRQVDRKGNLPITVIPNVATNSLVISGPKFEFDALKPLLAQLDVKPSTEVELNLRTYPLRYATAGTLVSVIQTAFPSRSVSSPRDQVMVTSDPTTNTLIVQASGENHDRIGEMLDELDVSGAGNRKTQVIPIENADPQDVATALNGIFEDQVRSRGTNQKMTITHPEGTRKIVVTATEREFEEVFEILKDLDVDATENTDVTTIKLRYISVNDTMNLLQDYLRKPGQRGGSGELVGNVKIIPLEATGTLLLSGDEKQLANIEGLIQRIDIETPKGGPQEGRITKIIPVANADASAVADFVSQSTRRSGNIPDIERVDISFDPGTRSVIVMAKKSRVEDIEKLIAELDKNSERTTKVERIHLKHAPAEDLENVLEDLYESGRGRGRDNANPIQIEADANSNSLLVSAIPSDMEKIRALVAELDTADQEGTPKILKLEHAEASQVVSVLTRIFAETRGRGRGRRGDDDAPVIEAMDASNSIIVRAPQNDLSMIEEMVKKLDSETQVGIATVKVIPMDESVDVVSLAEELQSIVNEGEQNMVSASGSNQKPRLVSVQGDARTNSLLVAGAPSQFSVVEQLAKKLEGMGPRGPKRIRIINLKNVGSEDVKDVIEQLIEQQNSSSSPRRTGFRRRSRF